MNHSGIFFFVLAYFTGEDRESRSVLQEQSTALGLGMFALLVQHCTELLKNTPAGIHTH